MKLIRPLIILFIAFVSCEKEYKPFETEVKTIEAPFEAAVEVNYELLKGNAVAERINGSILKTMISTLNDSPEKKNEDGTLQDVLKNFDDEYISFASKFEETPPWQLFIESEVTYQSNQVITVAINTYIDKGGAHGNDTIRLLNFNPSTGEVYQTQDLIKNKSAFLELAEVYFYKNVSRNSEKEQAEDYFFGESFQLPNNIGFDENGIILLYNVYEIASYSQGYTEFVIPYEEANAFLSF